MKRFLLLLLLAFAAQHTVSAAPSSVDPTLLPLQKGEIQRKLRVNKDNAYGMVLLLLRADEMSTSRVDPAFNRPNPNDYNAQALQTLEQMRKSEPNNMKVLGAYCFALDIKTQGGHHQFTHYKRLSSAQEQQLQAMLKEVEQKMPKLWLPYAIEGYHLFYRGTKGATDQNRGIELLGKAVKLAPTVPLVHHRYGYLYHYAADWQKKPELYANAVAEYQKALQSRPLLSAAALDLLYAYAAGWLPDGKPNIAKAKVVAQRYLSMLPKGYVFAGYEKEVFAIAGIKV